MTISILKFGQLFGLLQFVRMIVETANTHEQDTTRILHKASSALMNEIAAVQALSVVRAFDRALKSWTGRVNVWNARRQPVVAVLVSVEA